MKAIHLIKGLNFMRNYKLGFVKDLPKGKYLPQLTFPHWQKAFQNENVEMRNVVNAWSVLVRAIEKFNKLNGF